jgi:DNA-binding FrmR family transcriptional regulator
MSKHLHRTHPDIVKRLRRADGHLQKVISMIEEGRPCLDLAQQLHAVESAGREANPPVWGSRSSRTRRDWPTVAVVV